MTNGMFENLAAEDISAMVASLENQLPMLTETDQQFILGCRMHMESGTALTAQNQTEVRRIASTLTHVGHNTLGGALSPKEVLQKLASVRHTLTPQEGQLANQLAQKMQQGQALTPNEVTALLNIYTTKGF